MKAKKPLPKWVPLAGIVALGVAVLVGGWLFVVSPQRTRAADLRSQAQGVRQKIAANLAAVAAAKSAPPVQTIRVADVYKLAKAMPSTEDMPDLLIELSQVTRDAGVGIDTLSPGTATSNPAGGQLVPIALSVSGDFFSITDLLYRLRNFVYVRDGALEANGRLFSIDAVNLSSSGGKLSATIQLHAFVYGQPALAAPVAPAATSTTTTTEAPATSSGPSAAGAP